MFGKSFNPVKDIPDQSGKVVVVTGANSGLGLASVKHFASHNASKIYLTTRSLAKGQAAADSVKATHPKANIQLLQLDIADFDSVKKAAEELKAQNEKIDILLLNAGISSVPHALSKEGYEVQFGTNHMGHALLTQLLMPLLLKTAKQPGADVRVVAVSSHGHKMFPASPDGIIFDQLKTPMKSTGNMALYGQSKLANIGLTHQLALRYPSITTAAIHPGTVITEIWKGEKSISNFVMTLIRSGINLIGDSADVGAYNQMWASTSKDVRTGSYYVPVGKLDEDGKWTKSEALSAKLWDWTNKELAEKCGTSWPSPE